MLNFTLESWILMAKMLAVFCIVFVVSNVNKLILWSSLQYNTYQLSLPTAYFPVHKL